MDADHPLPRRAELSDTALAAAAAAGAGRLLLELQRNGLLAGPPLGAAADALAHGVITRILQHHRPQDAVLSEEAPGDPTRLVEQRVWIVDPLDGTREYGELRADWTVHVALSIGGAPGPAAVALPAVGLTADTQHPPPLAGRPAGPLRIVVSRTRPPPIAQHVAARLGASLIPLGSVGAKMLAVLQGEADLYLHAGGQFEWDTCAPVAVALAAGLHASRTDGAPCVYNRPDPCMPDLLICRPGVADLALDTIAACFASEG